MDLKNRTWSSGITFILAAVGAAVGLGNIWKFPYVAGVSGGGAFVLVYVICVIFVAIPILICRAAHRSMRHRQSARRNAKGRRGFRQIGQLVAGRLTWA